MKPTLVILFILSRIAVFSQSDCDNIDFENGTTTNWNTSGFVEIVNRNQEDPYGHFPLSVSGFNAVKLGNKLQPTQSKISRQITIDSTTKYFIYSYSIVFLGYPHLEQEASFVSLHVKNQSGEEVPCTLLYEYAQPDLSDGFIQSTEGFEQNQASECCYPIYYKPWTTVAVDLTPYINQTLTFELSSSWCIYNVDWGYAYVDAFCSSNLIYEFTSCDDQTHFIGTADGFDVYNWSGPGIVSGQGTNQIEINEAGTYLLDIPNSDIRCASVHLEIEADLGAIPSIPTASFNTMYGCVNQQTNFVNTSNSVLPLDSVTWYLGEPVAGNEFDGSLTFDSTGTYEVSLIVVNEIGCSDTVTNTIVIQSPAVVSVGPDIEMCPAYPTYLTAQSDELPIVWSTGETTPTIQINYPGYYWVTASENGCAFTDTILVDTSGAFLGEIPNVFTPNNDDVNDYFEIESNKTTFYKLVIMNRWENILFQTSDYQEFWDGKFDSLPVEDGTYFYKLTYQFECMTEPEIKSGFIHLIRNL